MKRLLRALKEFFRNLFGIKDIYYIDMLDEYEEYVENNDLEDRNTLVGVVRSVDQYMINYNNLFYHAPQQYVPEPDTVKYVALYRSKNLFGDDSGVIHYGRVSSLSLVERCDIKEIPNPNSHDKYYRFEISEWQTLPKKIIAGGNGPNVCMRTNKLLLEKMYYFNELLISNNNEYKLHLALLDISRGVYVGFFVGNSRVYSARNKIYVITPHGKKQFKISDYNASRMGTLRIIYNMLFESK